MRLLKVNNLYIFGITSAKGGIESLMNKLILRLSDVHHETNIHIVTSFPKIAFEDEYKKRGVCIVKIPFKRKARMYMFAVRQILKTTTKSDVIYVNSSTYCNWMLFGLIKKCNAKVIIHGHNSYTPNIIKKIIHLFGRALFKNVGYKIAVSESCNRFMFNNKADSIINNGIDSRSFYFNFDERNRIRTKYSIKSKKIVIGCLGRISKEKNQIQLIKFANRYPNYLFVFIGGFMDDNYKKKILNKAQKNCLFVGEQENVGMYLSSLDALFMPSRHEGFPLAAIEAITNGLPVFCYKKLYKTLPEGIKNNKNTYVFDKDTFNDLFLNQSNQTRSCSNISVNNDFDINIFLHKIEEVIYG